jgi:hypothetical protein
MESFFSLLQRNVPDRRTWTEPPNVFEAIMTTLVDQAA